MVAAVPPGIWVSTTIHLLIALRQILFCWIVAALLAAAHESPRSAVARLEIGWPQSHDVIGIQIRVPLVAVPAAASFPQFGPGFLDFERTQPLLQATVDDWIAQTLDLTIDGVRVEPRPRIVSARLVLESDPSPVRNDMNVYWSQAVLECTLEYRPAPAKRQIVPRLAVDWRPSRNDLRVQSTIEFIGPGIRHQFRYDGDIGPVALNPSGLEVAARFCASGFTIFARSPDLLYLLAALLLPIGKRLRRAFSPVLMPFALALVLSFAWSNGTGQPIWWPSFTGAALAVAVFYAAVESAVYPRGWRRRWILAFCGGLIAGIALSLQFREIVQFAAGSSAIASAAFVTGIVLAVAGVGFTVALTLRWAAKWWFVRIAGSAAIAHHAWHTLLDQGSALAKYEFWPSTLDTVFLAGLAKAAFALTAAVAVAWLYGLVARHPRTRTGQITHAR